MASHDKNLVLSCLALLLIILISNSLSTHAKRPEKVNHSNLPKRPSHQETYKFAKEFCDKTTNSSKEGHDFCIKILATNPRSASAKSDADLLNISIDLAVGYLNVTKGYMETLLHNIGTKEEFLPALKQCIDNYHVGVIELVGIPEDMEGDPALGSYDATMAYEQLGYCEDALKSDNVEDDSIWSKHEIATASVRLCEEIARTMF